MIDRPIYIIHMIENEGVSPEIIYPDKLFAFTHPNIYRSRDAAFAEARRLVGSYPDKIGFVIFEAIGDARLEARVRPIVLRNFTEKPKRKYAKRSTKLRRAKR